MRRQPRPQRAERTLPHNLEAERSVLGAILIDNEAFNIAAAMIDAQAFFRDAHRRIFERMLDSAERSQPIDLVTLKEELERAGRSRGSRRPRLHRLARRRRAARDQRRVLRADRQREGDAAQPDLLGEQDPLERLRGRPGSRPDSRRGRERDLRGRRRPHQVRLCRHARPGQGQLPEDRASYSSTRASSPACRPASPRSTR